MTWYFSRGRAIIPNETQTSKKNLHKLPTEILQLITYYLPPDDIASLTLCNCALLKILGCRHLLSLRPAQCHQECREAFLVTLTRDLPQHFYCRECSHLHLRSDVGPPSPAQEPKGNLHCLRWQTESAVSISIPYTSMYQFAFPHLQLAMERHDHGLKHGISTESLTFTEVWVPHGIYNADSATRLLSVEARICSEPKCLYLRIQQWVLFTFTNRTVIYSIPRIVTICRHLGTRSPEISQHIESQLESYDTGIDRQVGSDLLTCRYCNTDIQIERKKFDDERLALIVTKWLDLGSGLTLKDIRWTAHSDHFLGGSTPLHPSGAAGNIRLRFENEPGLSQDTLSRQNELFLTAKQYMRTMDHWKKIIGFCRPVNICLSIIGLIISST